MLETLIEMYSYEFMQHALIVGVFGGGLLAFLGIFVHLRRIVFFGAALPQIVATGIAIAVFASFSPIMGAALGGLGGVLLLSTIGKNSHLSPDGWVGIGFAAGSSIAIVLVALSSAPDGHVLRFFTGDILGTSRGDALWAVGTALAVSLLFGVFWSRLLITAFDPVMSATLGIKIFIWNALFFLALGIALAVVMNTSGGMLAFSMLVGPPASALLVFRSFKKIIIMSVASGVFASFLGLTLSFLFDLPGGPTMAAAALLPVCIAWPISVAQRHLKSKHHHE